MRHLKKRPTVWTTTSATMLITVAVLAFQLNSALSEKSELEEEKEKLNNNILDIEEEKEELSEEVDVLKEEVEKKDKVIEDKKKEVKKKEKEIEKKDKEIKNLKVSKQAKNSSVKNTDTKNNTNGTGNVYSMEGTFYTAFCDTGCTGVTATGIDVSDSIYHNGMRIVAVDPSVIKLGSTVRVTGGGMDFKAIAADTGGDIKGNRIDILVANKDEAYALGRKQVQVEVIN